MSGMFPLVLDDAFRAEVMRVVEYASKPAHYYVPALSPFPPGDMPEYTMRAGDYRIVYSVTMTEKATYRHMTVSLTREGAEYPAPISLFTIAHMFGFTGADVQDGFVTEPAKTWMFDVNHEDRCVVLAEPLEAARQAGKR